MTSIEKRTLNYLHRMAKILSLLDEPRTRAELCQAMGMKIYKVRGPVLDLIDAGLIVPRDTQHGGGRGRPGDLLVRKEGLSNDYLREVIIATCTPPVKIVPIRGESDSPSE